MVTLAFLAGAAAFGACERRGLLDRVAISALLLVVAGPLGDLLPLVEGEVERSSAGDHVGDELRGLVADVLELRDRHVLDADPGLRIDARLASG